jgi:hypothetical protein
MTSPSATALTTSSNPSRFESGTAHLLAHWQPFVEETLQHMLVPTEEQLDRLAVTLARANQEVARREETIACRLGGGHRVGPMTASLRGPATSSSQGCVGNTEVMIDGRERWSAGLRESQTRIVMA